MSSLTEAQIRLVYTKNSAFFASLMYQIEWEFSDKIPTAGINKTSALVNETWFNTLNEKEQVGLLAHEILHVALAHQPRRGNRDAERWNKAGDYLINFMLKKEGYVLPTGGLYDPILDDHLTTEQIYDILGADEGEEIPKFDAKLPMEDISGDTMSQASSVKLEAELMQLTANADTAANMDNAGSTPSNIALTLQKYLYPPIPWETILFQYFCEFSKEDYSMGKRNRRFNGVIVPALHSEGMGKISTYLDISCSVTDEQFAKQHNVMMQIKNTVNPSEMEIVEFDTSIKEIRSFNSDEGIQNLVFTGRGGTCLREVASHIGKGSSEVSVIFTDGHVDLTPIEALTSKHIIWCIIDNKKFTSKIGKIIHLGEP